MPISPGITVTGTPITTQLGVGAVAGNTLTYGGLTLAAPPGYRLISAQGGPGNVEGVWQSPAYAVDSPTGQVSGGFDLGSGKLTPANIGQQGGGAGGGSGDPNDWFNELPGPQTILRPTFIGWAVLGIALIALLKGGKN